MCGIVGLVHADPARPVRQDTLECMCASLRHRGPDDQGICLAGPAGLGMRRLSIIDLAGGQQPMHTEDGNLSIVFNGEIYNYRALRSELVTRRHTLRTHSDTETVLHLFEEFGPAGLDRLRGMFALAIWNRARRTLFLARDRFGIKPLYVARGPWGLAFSSELKALLAVGLSQRRLNWDALDAYLQLGYIPAPASPFQDVTKLEPGHWLRYAPGSEPEIARYWDHPHGHRPAPRDAAQRVREVIDASVRAHLEADVPVAAFLSGGLDSSAVVTSMAAVAGTTPHAFTVRYHGSDAAAADETGLARALADRYGIRLTIVDVHPQVQDIFEPIVRALDEPLADDSAVPTWLLSEAVAREYKVALSGMGGDELFAGYRRHLGMLAGHWYARLPAAARRTIAAAVAGRREPDDGSLGLYRLKRFTSSAATDVPTRFLEYVTRLGARERKRLWRNGANLEDDPAARRFKELYDLGEQPAGLNAGLYLDYKTFLPDDILALSDRLSMAHSLEVRVPLVDHEVVEEVFPWPDRVKLGPWRAKRLLRRALRSRLPDAHFRAPKRGFVGPTASWLRHELRPLVEDELATGRMQRLGWFDPAVVSGLLEDHRSQRHNREGVIMALLHLSVWHRLMVEELSIPYYA